ncbi:MAG TPA: biosynthetic-type acetolactate synthase large subunit [Candidatus Sumerlaeota bacterium]|nr:biosynthetic-type acetolactate synthase large subunit [Candidatus Sumerlaeota bacterium]
MGKAMKGSEIVMDALVQEGVEVFYGYPGGAIMEVFDVLNRPGMPRFILVRHEQAAGHMADGYARATGRTGVCLVTSGPGATNIATAIATAYMDSIPMVAITGQVVSSAIGNDAFQEVDVVGFTRPFVKHSYLVRSVEDLPRVLKEAFYIANSGRPGPVVVDVPKDIQQAVLENYEYPKTVDIRSYRPTTDGNIRQIKRAAGAISKAQRPLLYVGGGANCEEAQKYLVELAERCQIPCTTTLLGKGAFPEDHPYALHMLGMHGTQYANWAMHETDCIIAVGARFDDRVTGKLSEFAPRRENIIHIDIDPSSISKSIPVNIPLVGDCCKILEQLLTFVEKKEHPEWIAQCDEWKKQYPLQYRKDQSKICPQFVIEELHRITKGDAMVVTEVGQHQMWTAHYWRFAKPRHFLSSGGLGTMGYGFPASLGAKTAFPDRHVVVIAGDGSIQMNMQELTTAVNENLPVKVVILNNGCLGMVRQWQEMFYKGNYSGTQLRPTAGDMPYRPDFVKLAEAFGAVGMRASKVEEVAPTLERMLACDKVVFAEFIVEETENVFPMIPAGAGIRQMMGGMA